MRIALVGASSSRKSTVAYLLVGHLKEAGFTAHLCQEYARTYLERFRTIDNPLEQVIIYYGQREIERTSDEHYQFTVSDSASFLSYLYYGFMAERAPFNDKLRYLGHLLDEMTTAAAREYQKIYLLAPAAFIDDGVRLKQSEQERLDFHHACARYLGQRGIPYQAVEGETQAKLATILSDLRASGVEV